MHKKTYFVLHKKNALLFLIRSKFRMIRHIIYARLLISNKDFNGKYFTTELQESVIFLVII